MMKWIKQVIKHTHSRRFTRVAGALLVALVVVQLVPTPAKSVTADDSGTPAATDTTADDNKVTSTNPTGSGYFDDKINAGAENDVLFEAQRFALFGDTVHVGSTLDGNVAANTLTGSTQIGTDADVPPSIPKYNGEPVDLFYIKSLRDANQASMIRTELAKQIIITGEDPSKYSSVASRSPADRPPVNNPDYIHISATLNKLHQLSELYSQRGYTFKPISTASGVTAYDMTDMDPTDTTAAKQQYENTYALRVQKTGSDGQALGGAIFELQYPVYYEDQSEQPYDSQGFAIPKDWLPVWQIAQNGGTMPALYGWDTNMTQKALNNLDSDQPGTDDSQAASASDDKEQPGNPVYVDGKLKTITYNKAHPLNLYDRHHNLITSYAEYIKAMTTMQANGQSAGDQVQNIDKGTINVSLNVPGRYRFSEMQAPANYSVDAKTTTDVNTEATNIAPEAKVLTIPWTALYSSEAGQNVSKLYLLNVDLSDNAPAIIINVDFTGAPSTVLGGAPNIYILDSADSGSTGGQTELDKSKAIDFTDPAIRRKYSNKILWNFFSTDKDQSKSIDIANDDMPGTILAPTDTISMDQGHLYGSIIANKIDVSGGTVHRWDFNYQIWSANNNKEIENRQQNNIPRFRIKLATIVVERKK